MKKAMAIAVGTLAVLVFIFSGVGYAAENGDELEWRRYPVIKDFELVWTEGKNKGNVLPKYSDISLRPGQRLPFDVRGIGNAWIEVEPGAGVEYEFSVANPSQGRINIQWNVRVIDLPLGVDDRSFDPMEGELILSATRDNIGIGGPFDINIQLDTSLDGTTPGSSVFPLTVWVRDGGDMDTGGGTCNAAGLGFLALSLPLASLVFFRNRKKKQI
ncbi:MAG: hypothetical protein FWG71_03590 [Synergistaceae bacterium]|nr:hypothetical protein [Synergistaceae bacterium]